MERTLARGISLRHQGRQCQAERSAITRAKLIAATIGCLHRVGYSATAMAQVADIAKVSRGAMTHHFPAKLDLMIAVVRQIAEDEAILYRRLCTTIKDPCEAFYLLPHAMWKILSKPSGIAVTEIMLASRSDAALASALAPIQREIEHTLRGDVAQMLDAAGIKARADGLALHYVFQAAIRGLAIDALFTRERDQIEAAVKALETILRTLYPNPAALR